MEQTDIERLPRSLTWDDMDKPTFLLHNTLYVLAVDLVLYPSDLLTTRLQADHISCGNVSILRVFRDIIRREGVKGLFRGFAINTLGHFPGQFLYYSAYEYSNQRLRSLIPDNIGPNSSRALGFFSNAAAGGIAEAVSAFSYLPTDIITQRLQVHAKRNFHRSMHNATALNIVRHIYMTEGLSGFFRGFAPYIIVHGPGSAIWWASYEISKSLIFQLYSRAGLHIKPDGIYSGTDSLKLAACVVSGALAGAAGYVAVNPLEVAKTRLQLLEATKDADRSKLRAGFLNLLLEVYRNEGIRGLFKGIRPRLLIRVPVSSIAFVGYEYLKESSIRL